MKPDLAAHPDVLALLQRVLDEVREVRMLLELARALRPIDRRRAAVVLPAIHAVLSDAVHYAHEAAAVAMMPGRDEFASVMAELGCGNDLRPFGRFLARVQGANVNSFVLLKVAADAGRGAQWRVMQR